MKYSTSTMTAYYANKTLSHTIWVISITAGIFIAARTFGIAGALAMTWASWAGFELLRAAMAAQDSVEAGRVEKQVPTFSVYEGRFVSVGLEGGEDS